MSFYEFRIIPKMHVGRIVVFTHVLFLVSIECRLRFSLRHVSTSWHGVCYLLSLVILLT